MPKRCSELIAVSLSVLIAAPPPAAFANTVAQAVQAQTGGVAAPIAPLQLGAGVRNGLTTTPLGSLSLGQALPSVSVFNAAAMAAPHISQAVLTPHAAPVTAKPIAAVAPTLTPQTKAVPAVSQNAQPVSKQMQSVTTQVQDTLDAAGPIAQSRPEAASGIGAALMRLLTGAREHGSSAATPKARSSEMATPRPTALEPAGQELNASQREMLLDLEQIATIYTAHYAPIEWKQKTFNVDFVKEYEKIRQAVRSNPAITQREFHDMLVGFVSATRDYHTGIHFFSTERARLPMLILSAQGKYFIAYIDRASLPEASFPYQPGDEIVEFDGKPVADVVKSLTRTPNTAETDARLAEMHLTNRIGQIGNTVPKGPVTLKIRDASGRVRDVKMNWQYMPEMVPADVPVRDSGLMPHTPGMDDAPSVPKPTTGLRELLQKLLPSMAHPHAEALSRMAKDQADNKFMIGSRESFVPKLGKVLWEIPAESPIYAYVYEDAKGRKIGYIRIPDYMGEDQHAQIFAQLIAQFQKITDGLVIDQVNNPGGSVFYMYTLLSMLTDKPLSVAKHRVIIDESDAYWAAGIIQKAMSGDMMMKAMSDELKDLLSGFNPSASGMEAVLQYARFILSELKAGRRFTRPVHLFGMDRIPAHPQARYTKPVMVLVNETDFSAGDFFPATLQDNGRAKIFGVRTAGAGGGVKSVEFPNQAGIAGFSYTWTIAERPNGQPIENLGVTPDIPYQITADDLRTGFSGYKAAANAAMDSMLPARPQAGAVASEQDEGPSFYPDDDGYTRRPGVMAGATLLGLSALAAAQPAQLALALGLAALGTGLFVFNLVQAVKAWKQMKAMERSHDKLMGDLKKLK